MRRLKKNGWKQSESRGVGIGEMPRLSLLSRSVWAREIGEGIVPAACFDGCNNTGSFLNKP